MSKDRITLTVPMHGEYARTVRMTAAELAVRLGMSYDEVDDVRLATEEAFVFACDCAPDDAEVTFTFTLEEGSLLTEVGPLHTGGGEGRDCAAHEGYAQFILQSICDEFSIERTGRTSLMRLRRSVGTLEDIGV